MLPGVDLEIRQLWLPALAAAVAEASIDVAITIGLVADVPGVVSEVFCGEPLLIGVRPTHPLVGRPAIALQELEYAVLGVPHEDLFPAWALTQQQALETAGIAPPTVRLEASNLAASGWAQQQDVEWVLLTESLGRPTSRHRDPPGRAGPAGAVHAAVEPRPGPDRGGGAKFVHFALSSPLPTGWATLPWAPRPRPVLTGPYGFHCSSTRASPDTYAGSVNRQDETAAEELRATSLPETAVVLLGPVVVAGLFAVLAWGYRPMEYFTLHDAGRALLSGDLAVYAHRPSAQVGPLAMVLSALPRPLFVAVVCLMFVGVTSAARRLGVPDRAILLLGSIAGLVWTLSALGGHTDDQIVVLGAALMITGIREQRNGTVAWGFILALAGKPTGVVLAPLLLGLGWPTLLGAAAGVAALWGPFVLADVGGFFGAGRGIVLVEQWSVPFMLGEPTGAAFPVWVRPAQLVGGLVLCVVVARRNGPAAAVIAALAFRAFLEPGAWASYSNNLIVLSVLLTARRGPMAGLAIGSWLAGWVLMAFPGPVTGILHSGLLVALIVVAVLPRHGPVQSESRYSGAGSPYWTRRTAPGRDLVRSPNASSEQPTVNSISSSTSQATHHA